MGVSVQFPYAIGFQYVLSGTLATTVSWLPGNHIISILVGRVKRAYGKAGNGNETETGNGNWKRKPETENRNGNATSSLL